MVKLKLKPNDVMLLLCDPKNLINKKIMLINKLINSHHGLIITISEPYTVLKKRLIESKVNVKKLFFVDLITSTASSNPERSNDCIFINAPTALTSLGIALNQAINSKDFNFIMVDNLSTFLMYNDSNVLMRFIHNLINKTRINNINCIIISDGGESNKKLINNIKSMSDKVVKGCGASRK
ncbi:MAG: ATPase domain-containing protein [Candidatus Nanoarchaeia archaeon]|jgi:hypothetical protein